MLLYNYIQKFINAGAEGIADAEEVKRIRLSNLIILTIFLTGTPFSILFGLYCSTISGIVLGLYILSFFFVLRLNQLQKFLVARISMIILMNMAVIHYSIWFGEHSGLHQMLISFSCVPFLIFNRQHFTIILTGTLISIVGFLCIDFVDFSPFLIVKESSVSVIYYAITVVALMWILLIMIYFSNQNYLAITKLIKQRNERTSVILTAQEEEREYFSRELHDGLGQLLSAIKINVKREAEINHFDANYTVELIDAAVIEMRGIAHRLVPLALENNGLIPALENLVEKIKIENQLEVFFHANIILQEEFRKEIQINIYRIIQEALNNVLKHAKASEVNLQLIQANNTLTITIEDNGKGFSPNEKHQNGIGIQNIAARTEWMNGELTFDAGPGIGTTLIIVIPITELSDKKVV